MNLSHISYNFSYTIIYHPTTLLISGYSVVSSRWLVHGSRCSRTQELLPGNVSCVGCPLFSPNFFTLEHACTFTQWLLTAALYCVYIPPQLLFYYFCTFLSAATHHSCVGLNSHAIVYKLGVLRVEPLHVVLPGPCILLCIQ